MMKQDKKALEVEMKGEWILVDPTDCFTLLPIYECSNCKKTSYGYKLESICENCGSTNKLNTKKYIEKDIFMKVKENVD